MNDREYNLLDEKWILVRNRDCQIEEVSLIDLFQNAHLYEGLAGEMVTQDVSILRFLLAILYTVFWRVDENGEEDELGDSVGEAIRRWGAIWKMGHFPKEPISEYLYSYKDRFWLFDPDRPFWQSNEASYGTFNKAGKLIGEICESSNKKSLFCHRLEKEKDSISYAEAARWLLHTNGYDDCSIKKPSPKASYLSELGLVAAVGKNLFETLLLNLVPVKDGREAWEAEPKPVWESRKIVVEPNRLISVPDNQAELLTLQSRHMLLTRENGRVTGYTSCGGDCFDTKDAFEEQMSIWKYRESKTEAGAFYPAKHNMSRQMWRNLSSILASREKGENVHLSGLLSWLGSEEAESILGYEYTIELMTVGTEYGSMHCGLTRVYEDSLELYLSLLSGKKEIFLYMIQDELLLCDRVAEEIGKLAWRVAMAAGSDDERSKTERNLAVDRFYFDLDIPCREWISSIDPVSGKELDEYRIEWRENTVKNVARINALEIVDNAGPNALTSRTVRVADRSGKSQEIIYSAAKAYNQFLNAFHRIYS